MERYIDISDLHIPEGIFQGVNVPKLLDWLESLPPADVVKVKHGEIIKTGRRYPYCSECKCNVSDGFYRCPWCGAKFDGKENENG